MTDNAFRITYHGEIKEGWDPEEVKANLISLFRLDLNNQQHIQKIERLFSGRTVVIKDGINKETAQAYLDAIDRVGGKAHIKIKIGGPDGIEERRVQLRRKQGDRRATPRPCSILPDRRKNKGRRDSDPNE